MAIPLLKTIYIALGSNLGDRAAHLAKARERMESSGLAEPPELHIIQASSLYETEPRERLDQPWFLNQVVQAETTLLPRQLLKRLLRIEREMGRKRAEPNGPRIIDLDILLFGNAIVSMQDLKIPHPRMTERRFVLEPLAELSPELRLPRKGGPAKIRSANDPEANGRSGLTISDLLANVRDQPVRRIPNES